MQIDNTALRTLRDDLIANMLTAFGAPAYTYLNSQTPQLGANSMSARSGQSIAPPWGESPPEYV